MACDEHVHTLHSRQSDQHIGRHVLTDGGCAPPPPSTKTQFNAKEVGRRGRIDICSASVKGGGCLLSGPQGKAMQIHQAAPQLIVSLIIDGSSGQLLIQPHIHVFRQQSVRFLFSCSDRIALTGQRDC